MNDSKTTRRALALALAVTGSFSASTWANSTACSNGGVSRSIEVVYSDPGQPVPCEVIYDKSAEGGGQHSLWRANDEAGYCESRAAALADKLRGLGWTCGGAAAPAAAEPEPAAVEEAPAAIEEAPAAIEEMLGEPGAG
ncbi:MAG: hypothetical protein OES38_17765 [Gammaproteobacteria bacterium]|nr:hypothetical protein [Gammaproteobacteria bacterium]